MPKTVRHHIPELNNLGPEASFYTWLYRIAKSLDFKSDLFGIPLPRSVEGEEYIVEALSDEASLNGICIETDRSGLT
jgi:hypothetical protein